MTRQLDTIFCDDIRQEVTHKHIYIGVYGTVMFVQSFPFTLNTLYVATRTFTDSRNPFETLTVSVLNGDDVLAEQSMDKEAYDASIQSGLFEGFDLDEDVTRVHVVQFIFSIDSLEILEPCFLKVHAQTESELLNGLGLKIAQLPESID